MKRMKRGGKTVRKVVKRKTRKTRKTRKHDKKRKIFRGGMDVILRQDIDPQYFNNFSKIDLAASASSSVIVPNPYLKSNKLLEIAGNCHVYLLIILDL
jgi:hypothetical protein